MRKLTKPYAYLAAILLSLGLAVSLVPSADAADEATDGDQLQELFSRAEPGSTIDVPAGTYQVDDYVELPRADNVTVNAAGATFTGWVVFLSAGNSGMTWTGGTFDGDGTQRLGFTLLHVTDAAFQDIEFRQAAAFGQHLFDLLGSSGLTFDRITTRGYGDTADVTDVPAAQQYKEAIQTDYAIPGASGSAASEDLLLGYGGTLDGAATADVTIKNSRFLPRFDGDETAAWAQSPVGQHVYAKNDQNHGITFTGNTVVDPIGLNDAPQDKYTGALHFVSIRDLTIADNEFSSSQARRKDWIQVVNNANTVNPGDGTGNLPTVGVKITGNQFTDGTAPQRSYVMLMADKNNANFTLSDLTITGNTANTDGEPAECVHVTDAGSQIEEPMTDGNKGCR